jgi:hypothetical protein
MAEMLQPKRVTLNVTSMPALTALAELTKQTGYPIKPGYSGWFRGKGANVSVSVKDVLFWVAVREICSRGNVNLSSNGGGDNNRAVQIMPGNYGGSGQMKAAASIMGPFLTCVSDIERENSVAMNAPNQTTRQIHIQLQTFVEPKVYISEAAYNPTIDEAVDENGNSMMPTMHMGESWQSDRDIAFGGRVSLPYPTTNPGTRIVKLRGHIPARVRMAAEPFTIDDPLKSPEVTKTIGGRKVGFKSLKPEGNDSKNKRYRLEFQFLRGDDQDQDFNRLWNEQLGVHLTDSNGTEAGFYQSGGTGNNEGITRYFTFQNLPGAPVKLVIDVATGVQEINIPFELANLPMP